MASVGRDRPLELGVDRQRVAGEHRHPHAGARHAAGRGCRGSCGSRCGASAPRRSRRCRRRRTSRRSGRTLKAMRPGELLGLGEVDGVAVEGEGGGPVDHLADLLVELVDAGAAGAGHRLVGGDDEPAQAGRPVQRHQRRHGRPSSCSWGWRRCPSGSTARASGLTSLTTSGTSGSIRHAEELSMTVAPAAATFGGAAPATRSCRWRTGRGRGRRSRRWRVLDHDLAALPRQRRARPSGPRRRTGSRRPGTPGRRAAAA